MTLPCKRRKLGAEKETDAAKDGRCMDFNVYLGKKHQEDFCWKV